MPLKHILPEDLSPFFYAREEVRNALNRCAIVVPVIRHNYQS